MDSIQAIAAKINKISSNNKYHLSIYYKFLQNVGIRNTDSDQARERLLTIAKKDRNEESPASNIGKTKSVCVISTNTLSFAEVVNCNSEFKNCLGYERKEIIGYNIHKIIPSIYKEVHDGFIKNYLKKDGESALTISQNLYALKKNQLIVKVDLIVKIIPSVQKGF